MVVSQKKPFDLQVLGLSIRIRHDDENYVRKIQELIDKKIEMVEKGQKTSSTITVAARTIITLADELFSLSRERDEVKKEVEDKAKRLIEFIDAKGILEE